MSSSKLPENVSAWLSEPLPADVARAICRVAASDDVQRVAVMPDVHLATDVCVGLVVATDQLIYPAAVGGDIGCGMAAVRFDAEASLLASETSAARLLAGLHGCVPTNKHPAATMAGSLPDDLQQSSLSDARLDKLKKREGRVQFGTLGRGNHFLEFQADDEDRLWLMVHSGSRAMGQAITSHHLADASLSGSGLRFLESGEQLGQAYLDDVTWAVDYASQNRLAMIQAATDLVRRLFGVDVCEASLIQADHNHVRRETHFGRSFWVHRKGAQSARPDEAGVIPGSMGTASFHVVGRGRAESLSSSSHGAGRKMSRSEARRTLSCRRLYREMKSVWFDHRKANALLEEGPSAYKDIRSVMRSQKELTCITRQLRPLLSYKGR